MKTSIHTFVAAAALAALAAPAQADVITDWNTKVGQILADAKLGTPRTHRAAPRSRPPSRPPTARR
jgi:hypothetical protein